MHEEYKEIIKKSIEYIENHLHEELTTERVASHSAVSMYHFHRIFQRYVGMSVTDYIRKRRLTHAAQVLVSTERELLLILQCNTVFPHKRHLRELLKECFNCHQKNIESTFSHFI